VTLPVEHARRHDVTPIITFDQPLWWKALMIMVTEPIESDLNDIVIRLGGFHTEMSFLGAVGHLMAGSGLQELLETIYAPNAVVHMLSGKAISRAVRAHLIVDAALNALISARAFGIPVPECEDTEVEEVMEKTARNAAFEYICRCRSGKPLEMNSFQLNGGGKKVMEDLHQCTQTYLWLLMSSYVVRCNCQSDCSS